MLLAVIAPTTLAADSQHSHPICGASCTHESVCSAVTFTAFPTDLPNGTLASGNYYLNEDVQLTAPITLDANAVVSICLNGHVLKAPISGDNKAAFILDVGLGTSNATLNVADCGATEHKFTQSDSGLWVLDEQNGTKTVTGGVITGGTGILAEGVRYGGAMYIYGNNTVNIYGGNFVGNMATQMGGAVYMNGGTDNAPALNIYGGGFYGNVSSVDGGAIGARVGTITIDRARLEANKAGTSGGAIYTLSGYTSSNTTYINNVAKGSGAVWTKGTSTVTSDTYRGNAATGDGAGAIYLDGGSLNIDGSGFTDNTATSNGGAIHAKGGTVNIGNSHFENNESTGGDAGAVYVVNSGTTLVSTKTNYIGNKAKKSGGAIFALTNATVTIEGGAFTQNKTTHQTSDGNGGAIGAWNDTKLTVKNVTFTENEGLWGGAIRTNGTAVVNIENSTFTGNKAVKNSATTGYGGALRIVGTSNATVTGCTFTDNRAWRSGGAISSQSPITISDTTITGNAAGRDGGSADGGGIVLSGTNAFALNNVTIQNNTTTTGGRGAGVFNENGTLTLGGKVIVDGNTLDGAANDLYIASGATVKISEGGLAAESSIGYTLPTYTVSATIISTGATETDVGCFFADATGKIDAGYYEEHSNGALVLKNHTVHTYEGGVCILCKYAHTGHTYQNGTCTVCEYAHTDHTYTNVTEASAVCDVCGYVHTDHIYTNATEASAVCDACGYEHTTHSYDSFTESGAVCAVCGFAHTPHTMENDVCTVCGFKAQIHPICGATCTHTEPHGNMVFLPLPDTFTGGELSGSYYLDRDVTLTSSITVSNGQTLSICLNGHVLTAPTNKRVIEVRGTLNLTDCGTTAHKFRVEQNGLWVLDEQNGTETLTGGVITGGNSSESDGGGVYVYNGSFTMYGGSIAGNKAAGGGVYARGGFTMYGGSIKGNVAAYGAGVMAGGDSSSRIVMYGGLIDSNTATNGAVALSHGTFDLHGGRIENNTTTANGGGVYVQNATFNMRGGSIVGNTAKNGGGVYLFGSYDSDAVTVTFNLYDGRIENNIATNGGGVYLGGGSSKRKVICNISGGRIEGNTATDGGGVYFGGNDSGLDALCNISDGNINGNSATGSGGGIYIGENVSSITLSGGNIEGNSAANGGGVYALSGVTVSDSPTIGGNTVLGAANNICLAGGARLTVGANGIAAGTQLGIANAGVFANASDTDYSEYFVSDSGRTILYDEAKTLGAYDHIHYICGHDCTHQTPCGKIGFLALPENYTGGNLSGNYCLTGDVTLNNNMTVPWGETLNLCLNGHALMAKYSVFSITTNATLNLYDCGTTERGFCVNQYNADQWFPVSGGQTPEHTLRGGVIMPSVEASTGSYYGSAIAVTAQDGATFRMYGGSIVGFWRDASSPRGVIELGANNTLELHGGNIVGNSCGINDYTLYIPATTRFVVSGAPVISGNHKQSASGDVPSGVYLADGVKVIIGEGGLTDGARIGITGEGAFAEACDTDHSAYFTSDNGYTIGYMTDKTLMAGRHLHMECGVACVHPANYNHEAVNFQPLPEDFTGGELSGGYYLDRNVTLTTPITISEGKDLFLCLNGYVLTAPTGNHAIEMSRGQIILCDCTETEHRFTVGEDGVWVLDEQNGTQTLTGGVITGGNAANGGAICVSAEATGLHMYGGNIVGNRAVLGGGVFSRGNRFYMRGGNIIGNAASERGGGVYFEKDPDYLNATAYVFSMNSGATVMYNSAKIGGGVYAGEKASFGVEGTAEIMYNTASEQAGGVYLCYDGLFFDAVKIINNTVGDAANNVYFDDNLKEPAFANSSEYSISFLKLTDGAEIGIASLGEFEAQVTSAEYLNQYIVSDYADGLLEYSVTAVYDYWTEEHLYDVSKIASKRYAHRHYACGESECSHSPKHTMVGFHALPDDFTGGVLSGDYYLTRDVALTSALVVEGGKTLNLCLCGHVLTAPAGESTIYLDGDNAVLNLYDCGTTAHKFRVEESGLWVLDEQNGTKTVTGGVITGGNCSEGGGVLMYYNSKFTMHGGNIVGNKAELGGGINVYGDRGGDYSPEFTMYGGAVMGNVATSAGGGVCVWSGSFTMHGGIIDSNTAKYNGGGVYSLATFTLKGGRISNNTSTEGLKGGSGFSCGGGIYTYGIFTMNGGTVSGNTAVNGGGIFAAGSCTIAGGVITGNTAASGGGIYWDNSANGVISDCTITANTATESGGGVALLEYGYSCELKVSGGVVISGNTVGGAANNLQLGEEREIIIGDGGLSAGARIGYTLHSANYTDGHGFVMQGASAGDEAYFFDDKTATGAAGWYEESQRDILVLRYHAAHTYDAATGVCTTCGYAHEGHSYAGGTCSVCGYAHTGHSYAGGTCSICGYAHTEHSYEGGICTGCGYAHEDHNYENATDSGATCTVCGYAHTAHNYADGTCSVCGNVHTGHSYGNATEGGATCTVCGHAHVGHDYQKGTCSVCGYAHTAHSFGSVTESGATCTVCHYVHTAHSYAGGECTVCHYEHTGHSYKKGNCTVCGYAHEDHNYENATDSGATCTVCGYAHTAHTYANGTCSVCGNVHTGHSYENATEGGATCTVCGYAHTGHSYGSTTDDGASCVICGYAHDHSGHYSQGVCGVCNHEHEAHTYVKGTCSVCGYAHTGHSYAGGTCTVCGYAHTGHSFENGVCTVCHYEATEHTYQNGVCTDCGHVHTDHDYVGGECTVCHYVHTDHSYTGGECTVCHYKHTDHSYGNVTESGAKCTVCSYEHTEHLYSDGECTVCHYKHTDYNFANATDSGADCIVCGYTHTPHSYGEADDSGATCTVCNYEHNYHDYSDGECTVCHYVHTDHTYSYGWCTVCGYTHTDHSYGETDDSGAVCSVCDYGHSHEGYYSNGVCSVCGHEHVSHGYYDYEIDDDGATCYDCGRVHKHSYSNIDENGADCTECGYGHYWHTYENAKCGYCGYTHTDHVYSEYSGCCNTCGIAHPHTYESGKCTGCGYSHKGHSYESITESGATCSVCDYVHSGHAYADGKCLECGYEHTGHTYAQGFCSVCGVQHAHTLDENGACTGGCGFVKHIHALCGDGCGHTGAQAHESIEFLPLTSAFTGGELSGNYYVATDLYVSETIEVPAGQTLNLCLNGKAIHAKTQDSLFMVRGTMNLCCCDATAEHSFSGAQSQYLLTSWWYDAANGTEKINGGVITGAETALNIWGGTLNLYGGNIAGNDYAVSVGNGTFRMYDGAITMNSAEYSAVDVVNSEFYMYGGRIANNDADNFGAVCIGNDGRLVMSGGEIRGNSDGIYVEGNVTLSGSPVIADNRGSNMRLDEGGMITIGEQGLSDGARIGITASGVFVAANDTDYSRYFFADRETLDEIYTEDKQLLMRTRYALDSTQIAIGTDISVKFFVRGLTPENCDRFILRLERYSNSAIRVELTPMVTAEGEYYFRYDGITPQCIGDFMDVDLIELTTGERCDSLSYYSVAKYLNAIVNDQERYSATARQLAQDMLVYGEAARVYRGYKPDNEPITDAPIRALSLPTDGKLLSNSTEADAPKFTSASLWFDSVNKLRIYFEASSLESVTVTIGGANATITDRGNGKYMVETDGIYASQFATQFEIKLLVNGTVTSTLTYSVYDYIAGAQSLSDANWQNLVKALYAYGGSAIDYAASRQGN